MKKLLVLSFLCVCVSSAFAQPGKTAVELATGKIGTEIARQTEQAALQSARAIENATRGIENALYTVERVNTVQVLENTPVMPPHIQQLANESLPTKHYIKITNLPDAPTVKLGGRVDNAPAVLSARMLPGADSYLFIRPTDAIGRYTDYIFVPQQVLENQKSFYRGMRFGKIDELKNLLKNGLEINRSNYSGEIYAAPTVFDPLDYAARGSQPSLPVLIQIPETSELRAYAGEELNVVIGEVIFHKDIPAEFISDVWVFLEVNGKPDWYKVILENDELVFTPCGKMTKWRN